MTAMSYTIQKSAHILNYKKKLVCQQKGRLDYQSLMCAVIPHVRTGSERDVYFTAARGPQQ